MRMSIANMITMKQTNDVGRQVDINNMQSASTSKTLYCITVSHDNKQNKRYTNSSGF